MSEKKRQVQQDQTTKKKPASTPAGPELSPAEELLNSASVAPVGLPAELPSESNSRSLRQAQFLQLQRIHGNAAVQRDNDDGGGDSTSAAGQGSGGGAGSISNASVSTYNVSGATLDDITGQLTQLDGHGASTSSPLGMSGQVVPETQEDGSLRVEVPWAINDAVVTLPNWTDYDAACAAAQGEWDRFMSRARQHEQQAHVDAALAMVAALPEGDRIITGADRDELVQNMQDKQNEIAGRIQTMHDGCDHGVSIDAILHPDNGRCESEGEE